MAIVTYDHTPNSEVFVITATNGVKKAKLIQVLIDIVMTATTIKYTCAIEGLGTQYVDSVDIFPDVDAALAAYKLRIV